MRIGIISDTHGEYNNAEKAIRAMGSIDLLIHAGDNYNDGIQLGQAFNIKTIAVKGNTDFLLNQPSEKLFEVEGKNIFLTHGHKYDVKHGLTNLYYRALELEADIVIFGHSHTSLYVDDKNVVFINPGSPSRPRGGSKESYGILEIIDGSIEVKLFEIV